MIKKSIKINLLEFNTGQIEGLPKNPRFIRDERYKKLAESLKEMPSMMDLRELIVFPFKKKFIVIAGNNRLRACKDEKWPDIPCKILDADTPVETLKQIAIKDNVNYAENDNNLLKADWSIGDLINWGVEVKEPKAETSNMKHQKQIRLSYSEEQYSEVKEKLLTIAETPELAVLKLLEINKK